MPTLHPHHLIEYAIPVQGVEVLSEFDEYRQKGSGHKPTFFVFLNPGVRILFPHKARVVPVSGSADVNGISVNYGFTVMIEDGETLTAGHTGFLFRINEHSARGLFIR